MDKQEFLKELSKGLSSMDGEEKGRVLDYYAELIDDKVETGKSEAKAIEEFGEISALVADILEEREERTPFAAQKELSTGAKVGWILLLVLGSPVWLSLGIAVLAVLFSVFVSLWAVLVSLYAAAVGMMAAGALYLVPSVVLAFTKSLPVGMVQTGVCFLCMGLGLLLFLAMWMLTVPLARLTVRCCRMVKNGTLSLFRRKAVAQ